MDNRKAFNSAMAVGLTATFGVIAISFALVGITRIVATAEQLGLEGVWLVLSDAVLFMGVAGLCLGVAIYSAGKVDPPR